MDVNKINAFQDNKFNISKDYDFNKDGTVDIQDYNYALLSLEDADPDNDVTLSKTELQSVFKDLITEDDEVNPDTQEVNADNVNELSEEIAQRALSELKNPQDATTFNELQTIGQNLNKIIKRCTKLLPVLSQQIELKNKELEELQEDKDKKEEEYNEKVDVVNFKNTELVSKFDEIFAQSEIVSNEIKDNSSKIISKCIEDYKNGEYPNQDLYSIIVAKLAGDTPDGINLLNAKISETGSLGDEIKSLCSDIEGIVADIRDVTSKFNNITSEVNTLKLNRNNTLDISNRASAEYQKGYQKRLDLRQDYIEKYAAEGYKDQIEAISNFLDNSSSDMPFADAFAIMAGIGTATGIKFSYGSVQMPTFTWEEGDEEGEADAKAKTELYNSLAEKIRSTFGKDSVTGEGAPEDEFLNPSESSTFKGCSDSSCCEVPKPSSSDPISFSKDGVTNHFITDRDNDGILDNASEFLGAENGWEEMKAYDKDNNGIIEGNELQDLQMVSINDTTGQYTFRSAEEAGIDAIDLSTYEEKSENDVTGDVLRGEFKINMKDGSVVDGVQTDDTLKNINIKYSTLFGSEIKDMEGEYEDNVFMEEFIEKINTAATVASNTAEFNNVQTISNQNILSAEHDGKSAAQKSSLDSEKEVQKENEKQKLKKEEDE